MQKTFCDICEEEIVPGNVMSETMYIKVHPNANPILEKPIYYTVKHSYPYAAKDKDICVKCVANPENQWVRLIRPIEKAG